MKIVSLTIYYLGQSPCKRVCSKITTIRRAHISNGGEGEDKDYKNTKR